MILLAIVLPYIYRLLRPYIYRWMQRRAENYMRAAMGMPPRDKNAGRRRETGPRDEAERSRETGRRRERRGHAASGEPLIPKEYAEDVAFTEIHSYSEETVIGGDDGHVRIKTESQVSDAEIIEIEAPSDKKGRRS